MTKVDPAEAAQFVHWVKRAKPDELVERLISLSDAERRKYAKAVAQASRKAHPDRWSSRDFRLDLALAAVCSWTDAKRFRLELNFRSKDDYIRENLLRVLLARRPDWLDRWVERHLAGEDWTVDWPFVRALVREGACAVPTTDDYIIRMVGCRLGTWRNKAGLVEALRADPGLMESEVWRAFEVDPQNGNLFFDDETTWREEHKQFSWGLALVELAEEGAIDRWRLLQSCLETLRSGIQLKGTAFHVRLHDRLNPTLDERAKLEDVYLDLLNHPNDAVTKFAVRQLEIMVKAKRCDFEAVVVRSPSALQRETKGPAVAALRLLRHAVKAAPEMAEPAALAASYGLAHSRADVQEGVLGFIEGAALTRSAAVALAVREHLEYVAPSQRLRTENLLAQIDPEAGSARGTSDGEETEECGQTTPDTYEDKQADLESIVTRARSIDSYVRDISGLDGVLAGFEGGGPPSRIQPKSDLVPRLDAAEIVPPLATLDELIDSLLALHENAEDVIEAERAFDGLARLTARRPPDLRERTSALLQRAKQEPDGMGDYSLVSRGVSALVQVWLEGRPISSDVLRSVPGPEAFFTARLIEIERRIRGKSGLGLLALPTHKGAWIDPMVLVDRLRADSETPVDHRRLDFLQALLRLAPDHRQDALAAAADLPGERGAVLRFALGGEGPSISSRPKSGWLAENLRRFVPAQSQAEPNWSAWIAAARARNPFGVVEELAGTPVEDDAFAVRRPAIEWEIIYPKKARWSPDPSIRVLGEPAIPPTAPVDRPLSALCTRTTTWSTANVRARSAIWPMDPEPYSIGGCGAMCERLFRPASTFSPTGIFLEPLFDPFTRFAELSQVMLCLSLIAQDADARTMGLDATQTLVADGRADGRELGRIFGRLNKVKGLVKLNRVGSAVEQIAVHGALHQRACCGLLEELIATLDEVPRDMHHLLSPYRESLVATDRSADPRILDLLGSIKGSGKTARLAKLILEETGNEARASRQLNASWVELFERRLADAQAVEARLRQD